MGLDISHGCWSGGYGRFDSFRNALATAVGIDWERMEGICRDPKTSISWDLYSDEVICEILNHSDCEGEIPWEVCKKLAERLREIKSDLGEEWQAKTQQFIDGLLDAYEAKENIEFR